MKKKRRKEARKEGRYERKKKQKPDFKELVSDSNFLQRHQRNLKLLEPKTRRIGLNLQIPVGVFQASMFDCALLEHQFPRRCSVGRSVDNCASWT